MIGISRRRRILFLLSCLVLAAADGVHARAGNDEAPTSPATLGPTLAQGGPDTGCTPVALPAISVEATVAPVRYGHEKTIRALNRPDGLRPAVPMRPNERALGLTVMALADSARYEILARRDAQGLCGAFRSLTVTLALTLKVEIARELPRESCGFAAATRHENQHVAIELELFPLAKAKVAAALAGIAMGTVTAADPEAVRNALADRAEKAVRQALAEYNAVRRPRQAALDTPQEYAKVAASCGGRTLIPQ